MLAGHLTAYAGRADVVVLGAGARRGAGRGPGRRELRVPLDVLVVRKLGVPWAREVAFGAIGPGGVVVHNPEVECASAGGRHRRP